ncbi:IS6 family transposase [Rhodococcus sp. IC4_135]|uniref:IS6 family transposase n=1 Tax=Rhodococcus baikonurensis TaxID=172041 RepID=A0ABV5XKD3_9NOCA|nr:MULTISPECIES: IS6 family transposase [Rhodococcus]NHP18730.1 IS6 family transposase [Rhodococcus sp. IC4_135]OKA06557.1 IS6 family transposase [Rhodococcus erythropolis]MCZ4548281.1 IS6 family transposase [Rhodococcus qingshengii]OFE09901.1 IS6 family transposase [Rhodococcus sp. 1139]REK75267.1 IS6 family transposase [Rhodococcus erythropolis]
MSSTYKGFRFPREIIAHCVWLYHRFTLSFRDIELLMAERGVEVTYETIRTWCARFGPEYARRLRRKVPRPGDKWHLDEVFIKIGGMQKYLWRAVDQHGNVLDILIQGKRDGKAATRFFKKLLKRHARPPRVLITDKLASYRVAHRTMMSTTEHRQNKYLNNRCENSHQPTRQRERAMKGFRTVSSAQRFLAVFSRISPHFRPPRHRMAATDHRTELAIRFQVWDQVTEQTVAP